MLVRLNEAERLCLTPPVFLATTSGEQSATGWRQMLRFLRSSVSVFPSLRPPPQRASVLSPETGVKYKKPLQIHSGTLTLTLRVQR
jgi:hypothetical protein